MCDSYEKPILLIEWPKGLEFNLQGSVNIDSILREDDIEAKLCSLILRFPKLRLVWSQSPETSAKLLQTLMVSFILSTLASAHLIKNSIYCITLSAFLYS